MSDRPISVGDLVQVVRGCCNCWHGLVMTVSKFYDTGSNWKCTKCKANQDFDYEPTAYDGSRAIGVGRHFPLAWLKRIPPLDELEKSQTAHDLDIKEPA